LQEFALDSINLVVGDASWWKNGLTISIALLSDDNVSASEVTKVVCKCANRADDGIWVPAFFKLDPFSFDPAMMKQVFQIDRQQATRISISSRSLAHVYESFSISQ
jgi:hypothetical protein